MCSMPLDSLLMYLFLRQSRVQGLLTKFYAFHGLGLCHCTLDTAHSVMFICVWCALPYSLPILNATCVCFFMYFFNSIMQARGPALPLSQENPLWISWHDTAWIAVLNPSNVMDYFMEKSNPFYDRTCNNEIVKMQRQSFEQLKYEFVA